MDGFVAPRRIAAGYSHNLVLSGPRENGVCTTVYGFGTNDRNKLGFRLDNKL